jgi:acyl dehydratase
MTVHDRPFGRYLEDFEPGDIYRHWPGKTITEYDDHLFCMITMNHHPLHTNEWFAQNETVHGKNVVVGNLVYSLVLGMSVPDVSGAREAGVVQGRPGHRHGGDQGLQPARRRGLLLPAQGDGVEGRGGAGPQAALRRRRLGRLSIPP